MKICVEFGGGAEFLFGNKKQHHIQIEPHWKIKDLLVWLKENLLSEREELFLQNNTVRPGILVLVNDADWELMGEQEYEIQENDNILFISTLHGG